MAGRSKSPFDQNNDPRVQPQGIGVRKYPPIPEPDESNIIEVLKALKQRVELAEHRKLNDEDPVLVEDLIALGIVVRGENNFIQRQPSPPEQWHEIATFGSGWSDYGNPFNDAGVYKHNHRVYVKGTVTHTTSGQGTSVFTLPSGYRPSKTHTFTTYCGSGVAEVNIASAGTVTLVSGNGANFLSLDGISFRVR